MDKKMYFSKGAFKLIDFQMSFNELLFRCYAHNDCPYNIDILFKGVNSINIATTYKDITIYAIPKEVGQTVSVFLTNKYIFKIVDSLNIVGYIDSSAFGVFKNTLGFGETSLGDFMWSEENERIYWSHEDSEFINMFNR